MEKNILLFILLFGIIFTVSSQTVVITENYPIKSSDVKTIETNTKRIFNGFPLNGTVLVIVFEVTVLLELSINYIGAWINFSDSKLGWSGANPNDQSPYATTTTIVNSNGIPYLQVKTYFYQTIGYNILGQQIPIQTYPYSYDTASISYSYVIPIRLIGIDEIYCNL